MTKGEKTVEARSKDEPSNGLSRNSISLDDDEDVSSMIMRLNANFAQSLTGPDGTAAPFVITPDLAVKFFYSKLPDHRSPEMIPAGNLDARRLQQEVAGARLRDATKAV